VSDRRDEFSWLCDRCGQPLGDENGVIQIPQAGYERAVAGGPIVEWDVLCKEGSGGCMTGRLPEHYLWWDPGELRTYAQMLDRIIGLIESEDSVVIRSLPGLLRKVLGPLPVEDVRQLDREGLSNIEISQALGIDTGTVFEILNTED
jgi:hypothetical protein